MFRTTLSAALVFWLAASPALARDDDDDRRRKKPPQFRPFNGVTADSFYQSSVTRWADQLGLELGGLKAGAARLGPRDRADIDARIDRLARATQGLSQVARRGADRTQLYRASSEVGEEFGSLASRVGTVPALGESWSRVAYARQQLEAALVAGDRDPTQVRRVAVILAKGLDQNAEQLRAIAAAHPGVGFDQDTDRAVSRFGRSADRLRETLEDGKGLAVAGREYAVVTQNWGDVTTRFARVPKLHPQVRSQAAQVDALYRRLGDVLGVGPQLANAPGGWIPIAGPNPPAVPVPPAGAPPAGPTPTPNGKWIWEPGTGWLWDPAGPAGALKPAPAIAFNPPKTGVMAIGAGAGGGPRVRVFHDGLQTAAFDFFAYDPEFRGGVRVSVADLNGDGVPDLVTAPGNGMQPLVRVFDGRDMSLMVEFNAFDPGFNGGVTLAATDLTANGRALIAVGADAGGGPHVKVFDLAQGREIDTFFAYPEDFRGGVRVAWGDVDGDGVADLITAPGPGGVGSTIRIFSGKDRKVIGQFNAHDPRWQGGAWVTAANVVGGPRAEVIVGADAGGPPLVRVFDGVRGQAVHEFLAFPQNFAGGVRVAGRDFDGDGVLEIVCAAGHGINGSPVRVFSGKNPRPVAEVPAFADFLGGAFVGSR